jgi:hypothetical protein
MKLIIEGKDGRVLGARDLEGSRWEQVEDHFTNVQDVAIQIEKSGDFGEMYIKVGNGRIGNDQATVRGRLDVGSAIHMAAHAMRLSWNEPHRPNVWDDRNSGNRISFSLAAAAEVGKRAEHLSSILRNAQAQASAGLERIIPPDVCEAALDLLASIDDLLAALQVTGSAA